MPEERRRTEISDALWIKHTDIDGRFRGSMAAAGVDPLDIANGLQAIREAIAKLQERLVPIEEALAGGEAQEGREGPS